MTLLEKGVRELTSELLISATPENFEEQAYLDANPDVAAAVKVGAFASGRAHFELRGVLEGRYLRTSQNATKILSTPEKLGSAATGNSLSRIHKTVESEAFLWGEESATSYHSRAAADMESHWSEFVKPVLERYSIDYSKTIDFAAGYGRNTRKLLAAGAAHVTMVDVNPDCIAHLLTVSPDRTTAFLNDGVSLSGLDDSAFTFLYTFDAMVHFDLEIILSYIQEFARVLKPEAYAFVHHSNYTANPGGDFRDNPHWRNFMSNAIFKHIAVRSGFEVIEQELVSWGVGIADRLHYDSKIPSGGALNHEGSVSSRDATG